MRVNDRGTPRERFATKYTVVGDCWIWTAARSGTDYGFFYAEPGRSRRAHRFAYEEFVGEIPDGMQIDHLCRNRLCVNPDHLEVVDNRENQRRGLQVALKTTCARGHEWTPENIYRRPKTGAAYCVICHREDANRRYHARKGK